ncbi:MAG: flagellar biosynthesis protein FliQ [bacterium]|nr:flagellar biosynthesis protein FliQ [bacterium]MCP5067387.1 flagellar biosynthesis protein FliQ [bacterium]
MDVGQVSALLQETIRMALMLSAPILATALLSGLTVSIFQAATQINEQTLSFVPKIVLTLGVFAFTFPWLMSSLVDFGTRLMGQVATGGP